MLEEVIYCKFYPFGHRRFGSNSLNLRVVALFPVIQLVIRAHSTLANASSRLVAVDVHG